jgi:hypothetical protein
MKRYALVQVGCAECMGGEANLVNLRGLFDSVAEAMEGWPDDRDPWLTWRQDCLTGQWYAGGSGGGFEIVDLEG